MRRSEISSLLPESSRSVILRELKALTPATLEAQSLSVFVQQRANLISLLEQERGEWTEEERELLKSNGDALASIIASLSKLQKTLSRKILETTKANRPVVKRAYYGGRLDVKG